MRVSKRVLPYFILATLAGGVWLVYARVLVPLTDRLSPLVFSLSLLGLFSLAYLVPSWRANGVQWLQGLFSTGDRAAAATPLTSSVLLSAALNPLVHQLDVTHAWLLLRDTQANVLRPVALSGTPPRKVASPAAWPIDDPVLLHVQRDSVPLLRSQLPAGSALAADPVWAALAAEVLLPVRAGTSICGLVALGPQHNRSVPSMQQVDAAVSQIEGLFTAIDRALANETLARECSLFKRALEEAVDGLLVADGQLCVIMMNRAAEQLTATPASKAIGQPVGTLLGSDMALGHAALTPGTQSAGRVARLASRLPQDVLVTMASLDLGADTPGYLFCLTREEPLPPTHPQAAEILAEVSHELRAPLANIRVYTELLTHATAKGSAEDRALQQEWLGIIEQETARMAEQMETFLNLTRLESGTFSVTKAPLAMAEVVARVVASLQGEAARRGITVSMDAAPDLPTIVADERLLRMIAHNLISNAIKFSKDGGAVRVVLTAHQGHLQLEIEDQGIGIPREALPKLFTKFFRVAASGPEQVQGTGLGLALVKEAVAAHGGQVQVESALGEGSCFTVSLPVASEQELHSFV